MSLDIPSQAWERCWRREFRTSDMVPGWPRLLVAQRYVVGSGYRVEGPDQVQGVRTVLKLTIAGAGRLYDGRREHSLGSGRGFIATFGGNCGQSCYMPADATEPWEWAHIVLAGDDPLAAGVRAEHGCVFTLSPRSACLGRILALRSPGYTQARITAADGLRLVSDILGALVCDLGGAEPSRMVAAACRLLEDRRTLPPAHAVREVAGELGVSVEHLIRRMRAVLGLTPGSYLAECRMDEVRNLLGARKLPLREIARRVGFSSASHLVRAFRRRTGMTPGQWLSGHGDGS